MCGKREGIPPDADKKVPLLFVVVCWTLELFLEHFH